MDGCSRAREFTVARARYLVSLLLFESLAYLLEERDSRVVGCCLSPSDMERETDARAAASERASGEDSKVRQTLGGSTQWTRLISHERRGGVDGMG